MWSEVRSPWEFLRAASSGNVFQWKYFIENISGKHWVIKPSKSAGTSSKPGRLLCSNYTVSHSEVYFLAIIKTNFRKSRNSKIKVLLSTQLSVWESERNKTVNDKLLLFKTSTECSNVSYTNNHNWMHCTISKLWILSLRDLGYNTGHLPLYAVLFILLFSLGGLFFFFLYFRI